MRTPPPGGAIVLRPLLAWRIGWPLVAVLSSLLAFRQRDMAIVVVAAVSLWAAARANCARIIVTEDAIVVGSGRAGAASNVAASSPGW